FPCKRESIALNRPKIPLRLFLFQPARRIMGSVCLTSGLLHRYASVTQLGISALGRLWVGYPAATHPHVRPRWLRQTRRPSCAQSPSWGRKMVVLPGTCGGIQPLLELFCRYVL